MKKVEVSRDIFASVYLTLLGVVQATVFTDLSYTTLRKTTAHSEIDSLESLLSAISFELYIPVLFAFAVILLVLYEYIYFVQTASRFVNLFDIFPMLLLGFSEVVIIRSIDSPMMMWVGMILLGISGAIAFANSSRYRWNIIFGERRIARRFRLFLLLRMMVCLGAAGLSAAIVNGLDKGLIDEKTHYLLLVIFALAFSLWFYFSWATFYKKYIEMPQ